MSAGGRRLRSGAEALQVAKVGLGLAVGGALALVFASQASLEPVSDRLASADPTWLVWALAFMTCNIGLGVVRWGCVVRAAGRDVGFLAAAPTVLAARGANDVVPFRAGEVLKVASAHDRLGLPPWLTAGTLILERLLDAFAVAGILLCGAVLIGSPAFAVDSGVGLLLVALAGMAMVVRFVRRPGSAAATRSRLSRRLCAVTADLRRGAAAARRPLPLAPAAAASVAMWLSELGMFVAVGHAVHLGVPLGGYMVIQALSNLGLAIPGAPAGVGTFDVVALLVTRRVAGAHAGPAAYVLLTHAYLVFPSAVIGACATPWALPRMFGFGRRLAVAAAPGGVAPTPLPPE